MALLFYDSFDHYVSADITKKWTASGVANGFSIGINATGGRRSSQSFRITCGGGNQSYAEGWLTKTLAPADATCIAGCSLALSENQAIAGGFQVMTVRDGATVQVTLRMNRDRTLTALRGTSTGTVLGTSSRPLPYLVSFIEWKVVIHASAGSVEVRVNGSSTPILNLTGQNTRNTANTQWTVFSIGQLDFVGGNWDNRAFTIDWDDVYVCDGSGSAPWNTFLGDIRVDNRIPTGAGATTGWATGPTPAQPNYQMVDDAQPNGDTDYTTASASGVTDTFATTDVPAGSTVYGVQVQLSAKIGDAGTGTVAPVVRPSGSDVVGTDFSPVASAYTLSRQVYPTVAGTSTPWDVSSFNATEFGYKRTV